MTATAAAESSLTRALNILATFSTDGAEQSLGAIVASTGLPPATAHRYLA